MPNVEATIEWNAAQIFVFGDRTERTGDGKQRTLKLGPKRKPIIVGEGAQSVTRGAVTAEVSSGTATSAAVHRSRTLSTKSPPFKDQYQTVPPKPTFPHGQRDVSRRPWGVRGPDRQQDPSPRALPGTTQGSHGLRGTPARRHCDTSPDTHRTDKKSPFVCVTHGTKWWSYRSLNTWTWSSETDALSPA